MNKILRLTAQGHNIERVFTVIIQPISFFIIGLVSCFPNILWSRRVRVLVGYGLMMLALGAIPLVS
jgi:hypothetical protein